MSKHSEIEDGSFEKDFIEHLCKQRQRDMRYPCKGCKYRYPINSEERCCIFPSLPCDWSFLESRV